MKKLGKQAAILGVLLGLVGCERSSDFAITLIQYIDLERPQGTITGQKVVSIENLEIILKSNNIPDGKFDLKSITTGGLTSSFFYVTKDSELIAIKSQSGITTKTAFLRPRAAGVGIYVISGDPNVPIKVTTE